MKAAVEVEGNLVHPTSVVCRTMGLNDSKEESGSTLENCQK